MTYGVLHCVPRATRPAVVGGNHPRRMVNHPLVSPLETIPAVSGTNEPNYSNHQKYRQELTGAV